jgi:HD-GYP domain-containing protein (c-di-GMP phosphodiesterase class II)
MEMMEPTFLFAGLEQNVENFILLHLPSSRKIQTLSKPEDFENIIENPVEPAPALMFVGKNLKVPSYIEAAQFLKMQFPDSTLFFITEKLPDYNREIFAKNGYDDVFSLEIDKPSLQEGIKQRLSERIKNVKSYKRAKLVDIQPNMVLDFDTMVYLPVNNKYLSFTTAGSPLTQDRMGKLKKNGHATVYIPNDQIKRFYQYTSNQLKKISSDTEMSSTERQGRMRDMVRGILSEMVSESLEAESIASGRRVAQDCQRIVTQFMLATPSGTWYKKLLMASDETADMYSHSSNVSTFATLFSIATALGNPENIAFAGLIHDLGMTRIPESIREKNYFELKGKEKEIYESHIVHTMDIIKARKLILPEAVKLAVLQHHEAFNGTGYPKGLSGKAISIDARILAIADQFDKLIEIKPNKPRMSVIDAINLLKNELTLPLKSMRFDPETLKSILEMFTFSEEPIATDAPAATL